MSANMFPNIQSLLKYLKGEGERQNDCHIIWNF